MNVLSYSQCPIIIIAKISSQSPIILILTKYIIPLTKEHSCNHLKAQYPLSTIYYSLSMSFSKMTYLYHFHKLLFSSPFNEKRNLSWFVWSTPNWGQRNHHLASNIRLTAPVAPSCPHAPILTSACSSRPLLYPCITVCPSVAHTNLSIWEPYQPGVTSNDRSVYSCWHTLVETIIESEMDYFTSAHEIELSREINETMPYSIIRSSVIERPIDQSTDPATIRASTDQAIKQATDWMTD